MFNIFKKPKPNGTQTTLTVKGMHCTSCVMNIDGALEDTPGVISAVTNYAQENVTIRYDESKVSKAQIAQVITDLGYTVRS